MEKLSALTRSPSGITCCLKMENAQNVVDATLKLVRGLRLANMALKGNISEPAASNSPHLSVPGKSETTTSLMKKSISTKSLSMLEQINARVDSVR